MSIQYSISSPIVLGPLFVLVLLILVLHARLSSTRYTVRQYVLVLALAIYMLGIMHFVFFPIDVNIGIYANQTLVSKHSMDSASDRRCIKFSPKHPAVYATGVYASFGKALDSLDTNSSSNRIGLEFSHRNNTTPAPSNLGQWSQHRSERSNSQYSRKCNWLCHPEYVLKKFHRTAPNSHMGVTSWCILQRYAVIDKQQT